MLKSIKYCLAITCGMIAVSCSDINEKQQEWLDRGETIYAGKIDMLSARGGVNRIQILGDTQYAQTAEKCVVRWNDQVKEFLLTDIIDEDGKVSILLEDLEEGNYQFFVNTLDKSGNRSIVEQCFGYSYGESYASIQNPKRVVNSSADFSGATLLWNTVDKATKVRIDYRTKDLQPSSLELPGDVESTLIEDWEWGGEIKITTFVLPEENALDVIELAPVTARFVDYPEEEVSKAGFSVIRLPTDINGDGWGGKIPGMWDGIEGNGQGNRYHSESGTGVPHHFTFDLGVIADLSKVYICGRDVAAAKDNAWNPRHFQLWGRATLDGDYETTLPSNDIGWEAEAESKGWVLILDGYNTDRIRNTHGIEFSKGKGVRYIRYRAVESFGNGTGGPTTGANAYGHVQEMTLYATDIKDINN